MFLFKTLGISAAKRSLAVVTPTHYTKKRIAELSGIPGEKIRVIYEGPKTFETSANTRNLSIADAKNYLLHVGTMEKRKNIINLLKAFKLLLQDHPGIKLVLIGQFSPKTAMDDRNGILNFISNNNLKDMVILPGYVDDAKLNTWYQNALAYVFPSLNEGFGIPVLEAFRAGIPVLVADNSCLPEVGGDAVLTFDPYQPADIYQKLHTVLTDKNLQQDMIRKGNERLELFNWKNTADQLIILFKEISN